ncbi:MAG TPA: tetratricopeptide repeat protein [Caldimonas sp.]|jgi:hypothetical protein
MKNELALAAIKTLVERRHLATSIAKPAEPHRTRDGGRGRAVRGSVAGSILILFCLHAMATVDVYALWDYGKPALSEQRFVAALAGADEDDRLILQTQIARTYGLRRDFDKAREILAAVGQAQATARTEVRVHYFLELGRTYASPAHPPETQTPANLETARGHYLRAYELAESAQLDYLTIDALHMMVSVDIEPARQLEWNERALAYLERSRQPEAKKWEGSLRNNVGYAKRLQGDYDAALEQFRLSRLAYERSGGKRSVRIADWMIARTYRAMNRLDEAVALQLALERDWDADGEPDPYVYEELALLFRAQGDEPRAVRYDELLRATAK